LEWQVGGIAADPPVGSPVGSTGHSHETRRIPNLCIAPRHVGETDCMAGHIGFEVRRETGKE
jgi:hypothetical protein